ncbi:MAG: VanZ family protein [Candidatus Sulfotelmatobacter sp.]
MPNRSLNITTRNICKHYVLGLLCVCVLVGILIAGLWPFHAPRNDVSWLDPGNGLHFGKNGVMLGAESWSPRDWKEGMGCSIEIWLQPDHVDRGGTVLGFYSPENRIVTFSLHQSLDDLLLRHTAAHSQRLVRSKWYIEHSFAENKQIFITITSNSRSTAVYVNGNLERTSPSFGVSSADLTGQLVVGNNPIVDNGWQGQLRGLAIYDRELTPAEAMQHHTAWTALSTNKIKNENPAALYLVNEGAGNLVHNQMNSGNDLQIPQRYLVLHQQFLERPRDEFDPTWGYCKDVLINIGGFIPLGFFFYAYFSLVWRPARPVLATIFFGAIVSLAIEVLQSFLPTRDSGITDIITNTLGTAIGAALYSRKQMPSLLARIGLEIPSDHKRIPR